VTSTAGNVTSTAGNVTSTAGTTATNCRKWRLYSAGNYDLQRSKNCRISGYQSFILTFSSTLKKKQNKSILFSSDDADIHHPSFGRFP